jgi:hypothetical protein
MHRCNGKVIGIAYNHAAQSTFCSCRSSRDYYSSPEPDSSAPESDRLVALAGVLAEKGKSGARSRKTCAARRLKVQSTQPTVGATRGIVGGMRSGKVRIADEDGRFDLPWQNL